MHPLSSTPAACFCSNLARFNGSFLLGLLFGVNNSILWHWNRMAMFEDFAHQLEVIFYHLGFSIEGAKHAIITVDSRGLWLPFSSSCHARRG